MFLFICFMIGVLIGIVKYFIVPSLENDVCNNIEDSAVDEVEDELTPEEIEIIAQEKVVSVYFEVWKHEQEKLDRIITNSLKKSDYYYQQWKKTQEAEARYMKAEARLNRLKAKSNISYTINLGD